MSRYGRTPAARVLSRCIYTEANCLVFQGATSKGYGVVRVDGRLRQAHQVVWEYVHGPVPGGQELDHLCGVRGCSSPNHLEPVSHRTNLLRGPQRTAVAHRTNTCINGHDLRDTALVRTDGRRTCGVCRNAKRRKRREEE